MFAMLLTTGMSHFFMASSFQQMLPDFIPYKSLVVYLTGIIEILLGIGVVFNRFLKVSSYSLIIFFIVVFPVNVNNALNGTLLSGGLESQIPYYLWIRLLFQPLFIWWVILGMKVDDVNQTT
ncbi:hypothetical protein ACFFGV_15245 [Pontibacillus salicampi]|uniref:DoxX family membrane protein n=1 Tax=Pontibacillus salicampi TaxID=1449801 RepID=A0ABV6LR91_9BACI